MRIETRTRSRVNKKGEPEVWLTVNFLPRGSGNKSKTRAFAATAKAHPELGQHIKRVVVGTSSVHIVLRPSMGLLGTLMNWGKTAHQDVEGQLPLFG